MTQWTGRTKSTGNMFKNVYRLLTGESSGSAHGEGKSALIYKGLYFEDIKGV